MIPTIHTNNMNQQLSCSYCQSSEHTIQFCSDPQIEDAFKYLIGVSMQNAIQALDDFSDTLVCAIGVQRGRSLPSDTREQHREKVIDAVKVECEYLSQLSGIQRDEYLRWLYPNEDEDSDEDEDQDEESEISDEESVMELDDNVLVVHEVDTPCIITALLMCIETPEELAAPAECNICFDTKTVLDMDTFQCQHPFCHDCVLQMMVRSTKLCCPLCRTRVKTIEVKDVDGYNDIQDPPVYLYMA
jgi:Zinc finger, C3HC4 type (RING finger)